jgi:hypothetical protein
MKKSFDSVLIILVLGGLVLLWAACRPMGRWMSNLLSETVSAPCDFGGRTYTVHLAGENDAKVYGRKPRRLGHGVNPDWFVGLTAGDRLRLDTGRRYHDVPLLYGQPIYVNEQWYDVRLSGDRRTISAEPLDLETAFVVVPQENWSAVLVGESHLVAVGGTSEAIPVPTDRYFLYDYRQYGRSGERGPVLRVATYRVDLRNVPRIKAAPGEIVRLNIGTPLVARATAAAHSRSPGSVYLSMELTDAGGQSVDRLTLAGDRRPAAPKVRVFSADGKEVHAATLEYG